MLSPDPQAEEQGLAVPEDGAYLPEMVDDGPAWERRHGEPIHWYVRFEAYRELGPERSIVGAYRQTMTLAGRPPAATAPSEWKEAALKWQWRARAEAHDEYLVAKQRLEDEKVRTQRRAIRLAMLDAYMGRLNEALKMLKPGAAEWADVTAGLRMVLEQQRKEFGDEPASRVELSAGGFGKGRSVSALGFRELFQEFRDEIAGPARAAIPIVIEGDSRDVSEDDGE